MTPLYAQIERILTSRSATLELANEHAVADIVSALRLEHCRAVIVDRAPVFDKQTLLHALYQACRFPAYFGFNWDALADALIEQVEQADQVAQAGTEPGGTEPGGTKLANPAFAVERRRPLILIFQDFNLLRTRSPDVAETFLEIVAEISESTDGGLRQVAFARR